MIHGQKTSSYVLYDDWLVKFRQDVFSLRYETKV